MKATTTASHDNAQLVCLESNAFLQEDKKDTMIADSVRLFCCAKDCLDPLGPAVWIKDAVRHFVP